MISAALNDYLCITIILCYGLTNGSDATDVIIFYKKLSSLVLHIPKHNVNPCCNDDDDEKGILETIELLKKSLKSNKNRCFKNYDCVQNIGTT